MSIHSRVRSMVAATAALAVAGGLGLAVGGSPASLADESTRIQAQSATPPATTYAIIRVIPVGDQPAGIGVNDADDTVYVTNYNSDTLSVIDGRLGILDATFNFSSNTEPDEVAVDQDDDTVYVTAGGSDELWVLKGGNIDDSYPLTGFDEPQGVAVHQIDDTVYVANFTALGAGVGFVSVINGRSTDDSEVIELPSGTVPVSVAIHERDDTLYVTTRGTLDSLTAINGRDFDDSVSLGGFVDPFAVAVDQGDDTVYVTDSNFNRYSLTVIEGRGGDDSVSFRVGSLPRGVAVNQRDSTVYVANYFSNSVSVINGRNLDDSVMIALGSGTRPDPIAVDGAGMNQGVVYVGNNQGDSVSVIAAVTPTVTTVSGTEGGPVTITVDVPQVAYDLDDSTVTSVSIDDTQATGLTAGAGDTWTVTAPAGTGTVPVTVTFAGGLKASAGTFTYASPPGPTPDPVFPPSTPLNVTAVAGDGQAAISWSAPASAGSFPISDYEAVVSPGGQSCLVKAPTLSCTLTGLTNGVAHTATVRALNGAGWGQYSDSSAQFIPQPPVPSQSIVITGSRDTVRGRPGVYADGVTTGLVETVVRARVHLSGEVNYRDGSMRVVSSDGTFRWQRKTGKKVYVYFISEDRTVRSNRIIIVRHDPSVS